MKKDEPIIKLGKTIEKVINLIVNNGGKARGFVDYEIILNSDFHVTIKIIIKHGAFNELTHTYSRKFINGDLIQFEEIVNIVFHALTFEGSPYYLYADGSFKKKMQVVG